MWTNPHPILTENALCSNGMLEKARETSTVPERTPRDSLHTQWQVSWETKPPIPVKGGLPLDHPGVPRACLPTATPTLLFPNSGPFQFLDHLVLDITDFHVKLVTTQGESGPESAEPRGKSQFYMGPVITVGCCGQGRIIAKAAFSPQVHIY